MGGGMQPLSGDIRREQLGLLTRAVFLGPVFVTQIVLERQAGGLGGTHRRHRAGSSTTRGLPLPQPRLPVQVPNRPAHQLVTNHLHGQLPPLQDQSCPTACQS